MLHLLIKGGEFWNEKDETFVNVKDSTLSMEHSLVSISKWEQKWHKPFISDKQKTKEELMYYIKCMTITQNVDDNLYNRLNKQHLEEIQKYIENPMTATWFSKIPGEQGSSRKEQITSELVYYWMVACQIPFECEKWHFNRLMTLIRICNIKNKPPKKQSKQSVMKNNASLNAARKQRMGSSG